MIYTPLTVKAARIAYDAHHGQYDVCGMPYIFHPFTVAESMIDDGIRAGFNRESPQAKMLAKLLVTDLDDKRELTAAEANSMRYLTQSLKMQLRYKDVSKLDTSEVEEV